MKELSLALTLILTGLGMSQSKQFNQVPHAPPAAVEAISVGSDNPDAIGLPPQAEPDATAAACLPDGTAVVSLDTNQLHDTTQTIAHGLPTPTLAEQMLATANRLGPYRSGDPTLNQIAQGYADLLARTNQEGHYADGDPEYRARRGGFTGSLRFNERQGKLYFDGVYWKRERVFDMGEVLALGPPVSVIAPSVDGAFQALLDSPGHKSVLVEPSFDVAGFGYAVSRNGRPIWVGLFGNSQAAAPSKLVTAAVPSFAQCQPGQPCYQPRQSQPVYRQPQQTRQQPANRSYSQCGPGGCGGRGLFGRRR